MKTYNLTRESFFLEIVSLTSISMVMLIFQGCRAPSCLEDDEQLLYFLSIIEDYYSNVDNYKKKESYLIHISKNLRTIDKMIRSFNHLGKESSKKFLSLLGMKF
ncbi:MAG: hypothetical protein BAJALOKI2v1_70009 [Promethearchaeota archaeon]|nr:MAG: hypothetical protein BAJALOKI2v1_70009 [Candidatus Lokiarchaeota archaeon]